VEFNPEKQMNHLAGRSKSVAGITTDAKQTIQETREDIQRGTLEKYHRLVPSKRGHSVNDGRV